MRLKTMWWIGLLLAAVGGGSPANALPKFAREYHVGCATCHSVPPRLNEFGLAFQANFFNWPGGKPPQKDRSLKALPISGIAEFSLEDNRTEGKTTTNFRDLYLFASDGFTLAPGKQGGFFLSTIAVSTEDTRSGALGDAFVGLPVGGKRGQVSVLLGQFTPVMYQYDPINRLTDTSPAALENAVTTGVGVSGAAGGSGGGSGGGGYFRLWPRGYGGGGTGSAGSGKGGSAFDFSFVSPMPALAVQYFDGRGRGSADGNYVTAGVPFGGALALNSNAALHDAHGAFLHAFHREGWTTYGGFGWTAEGQYLVGGMGTVQPLRNLYVTGILATGHDRVGSTHRFSAEAEYVVNPQLALTGRLEVEGGAREDVAPVAAITYYPIRNVPYLRLTAEATQRKGDRSFILFARGQF